MIGSNFRPRLMNRIVDPVVNVKRREVAVAHTRAPDVGFIRQDQRRRYRVNRISRAFVMIADRADDRRDFLRLRAQLVQNAEGHDRTALRMIDPVDHVADIVQPSGDLRQFRFPRTVAER